RPLDDDRFARGDLPIDLRDDQPEPRGRETTDHRRSAVGNRAGRRQAEPRTARPLATDPRIDEAAARVRSSAVGGRAPSAFGVADLTQWTFLPCRSPG